MRRLDGRQLARAALDAGPAAAYGWDEDQRWTLARVTALIARLFRVTWARRGCTLVVAVSGRGSGRVSVAGLVCLKPGARGHLFTGYASTGAVRGSVAALSEADYARLVAASMNGPWLAPSARHGNDLADQPDPASADGNHPDFPTRTGVLTRISVARKRKALSGPSEKARLVVASTTSPQSDKS
jgi:hypothetical protein